ncbi:hypothetical protein Q1695_015064 [Nippostrongylus brasiliensis]|nr:hypothetical protein Q1695_015064 [Nippostrongylus brasiliensis]
MLVLTVLVLTFIAAKAQIASTDRLHDDLSRFLSKPRFKASEKSQARATIREELRNVGLPVTTHSFTSDDLAEFGINLLSIQRGPHFGKMEDKVVIVAANYDTAEDSPGVDDNGSGTAALLETARTVATFDRLYLRMNTIIYAFFDLKHQSNASVSGVLVLDGLLHFDAFPTSQGIPTGFEEVFPTAARELHEHQHMGDFVQVIGRERTDDDVIENFHMTFSRAIATLAKDWSFHPWILTLRLPMEAITSVDDMQRMHPYLFSDHSSFFFHSNHNITLPTIYITDTQQYRGVRQYCSYCDSLFMLTDPNMQFLTVITEAVIRTVLYLSESEEEYCSDELDNIDTRLLTIENDSQ